MVPPVFLAIILYLLVPRVAEGYDCVSETYNDISFLKIQTTFIPEERVYVRISCLQLSPGEYTIHVNWTRNNYGVIRADEHEFTTESEIDRVIYFWMKLSKKGLLKRSLSGSDYSDHLFGEWVVDSYINGEPVNNNRFTIN
jgi:hypothetical protein